MNITEARIAKDLALPVETVTQAVAILAKRRMGKSYLARKLAEQIFLCGQQLCIIDPKGDWWGVRSSADGKSDGLPILIIGGEHGDIPLDAGAGEVIAKLVVEETISVLLDLSDLRKHEVATFMAVFLETLYRLKAREQFRTPLMVIADEADALAPQKPAPNEARMLGAFSDLVRRGGQRGIGVTFITQRSAVLSKDVLTQAQILIALRVIAPQDLAAIKAWVDVHGTMDEQKTLMQSLPALPVGDAWVWSPGWPTDAGIFQRIHTLPISTFDSGATPKPGQRASAPKRLADIDLGAVRRQMAETLERAKANDPKVLRARIAELEAQLETEILPADPVTVEKPVLDERAIQGIHALNHTVTELHRAVGELLGKVDGWKVREESMALPREPRPRPTPLPEAIQPRIDSPLRAAREGRALTSSTATPSRETGLGKCERSLLAVFVHYGPVSLKDAAVISLYSIKSSTPSVALSKLRKLEFVRDYSAGISSTPAGLAAGPHIRPPTGAELAERWLGELGKCEAAILRQVLRSYPKPITLERAATSEGYSTASSTPSVGVSKLRGLALVHGSNSALLPNERLVR